jgi:hypothetical protein
MSNPFSLHRTAFTKGVEIMAKDAAEILEATRQKLIDKLLKRRKDIEQQLERLGYKKPA